MGSYSGSFDELMAKSEQQIEATNQKIKDFSIETACKSSNLMRNLRSVIETHPNESAKNLGLSILYLINDEEEKVLDCLNFLTQKHPDIPLIHRRIAEIYISRDDFETAITYLEKVLKLDKEDMTAKIWLGLSYYAVGNEKKAKIYLKCLKDDVFLLHASNNNWFEYEK